MRNEVTIELSHNALSEYGGGQMVDSLIVPHLRHRAAFKLYAKRLNLDDRIRAGRYVLDTGMSVVDIVRVLKLGAQTPLNVIFNNTRTLEHIAGRLASQIEADSLSILNVISSPEVAKSVGLKPEEMISIFIPNTYQMWWTVTPESLVQRMKSEYDRFWTPEREQQRKELNLSRVDVSTLASIVYEESSKRDEMPRIAGVYINRLRKRMPLQADPTVRFAMGDFTIQRVLHKHLKYDSPYNTYLHRGLPPGPICAPSIAALESVLNYEHHKYLYFCARPELDGYHNFSATYSQHCTYVKRYTDELNRRGIR